jgi:hypothetical protein
MTKFIAVLRNHFLLTTDWFKEAGYYQKPLSESRTFRNGTIAMAGAVIMGVFVLERFGRILPFDSLWLLLLSLVCVLGVWERTIRDHRKLQERLHALAPNEVSEEVLRVAAGGAGFGPFVLYMVAFLLICCLGIAAKHWQAICSQGH